MSTLDEKLKAQELIDPEMVHAAFQFWFSDNEHIRSPFPTYIREKLQALATQKMLDWGAQISEKAKKEINDEILAEKFEEIIFEIALNLVQTDDEKLTIRYPFILRLGDTIKVKDVPEETALSRVKERQYEKRGDQAFMKVTFENATSGEHWNTEFELPE
ncbi:MAG: hypothetical protein K1X77_08460 [Bacteroidia bacterium]|jgi:isopropylmalate/homocitrate/citramalate synthase|nr:hypothetical protein [Bacteroidia bacterium]